MAFSFGAPTPAPAATGGFGFGAPAPAPAANTGGLFGAKSPAPSGGLFGSTPTPAPATGSLFGATAPAPATTGLFGAPAPAARGLFGAQSPAPATGGLFGAPAAPQTQQQQQQQQQMQQMQQQMQQMQQSFSGNTPYSQLPDNAKRAIDQIYQLMMQHRRTLASVKTMAPSLLSVGDTSASNHYSNAKSGSSGNHAFSTPGGENPSPADAAAGSPRRPVSSNKLTTNPSDEPLPQQIVAIRTQIQTLLQSAETNLTEAKHLKTRAGEAAIQAKMHGAWPIENVAARRGVALSSIKGLVGDSNSNAQSTTTTLSGGANTGNIPASSLNVSGMKNIDAIALQQIMDIRAAHVDRIESMPSPYLWEVLHNFEQRVAMVQRDVEAVRARLAIAEEAERVQSMGGNVSTSDEASLLLANNGNVASLILYEGGGGSTGAGAPLSKRLATLARSQNDLFLRIAAQAASAHDGLEEVKLRYQRFCRTTKGGQYEDPFLKADVEEVSRERELQQRILQEQISTAPPAIAQPQQAPNAPAPSTGGLFGATAPAPSTTGLFGSTAPAPAPSTGGLFGSTAPAPGPSTGGLFGAPAPAPSSTPGGLFGSTPAPAPSAGLFGAPAPAPSGLFGSTPAPAQAATGGGGLFGSTAPAPSGNLFGAAPTTPASTLAPRKKSGSRSGGRRR